MTAEIAFIRQGVYNTHQVARIIAAQRVHYYNKKEMILMNTRTISSARTLASVGMFAALTLLATSVLRIPTPTFGYIHIGDCFVLLAGFLLGPLYGGLAAGIGSALSDLLAGYAVWVPGTFLIKYLTAAVAGLVFRRLRRLHADRRDGRAPLHTHSHAFASAKFFLPAAVCGELVMTAGYFLYNIIIVSFFSSEAADLAAAAAVSLAEIPFNLIQGGAGIVLAAVLYPVFSRDLLRALLPG